MVEELLSILRVRTAPLDSHINNLRLLPEDQYKKEVKKVVDTALYFSEKYFREEASPNCTKRILYKIDDLNGTNKGPKLSCKKGCAHCCYWKVEVSMEEAKLIANFVVKNKIDYSRLRMNGQIKEGINVEFWRNTLNEQRKCIFLTELETCGIYSVRPSSCRRVLVTSPPENCKTPRSSKVENIFNLKVEVLCSLLWTVANEVDPMALQINKLLPNHN